MASAATERRGLHGRSAGVATDISWILAVATSVGNLRDVRAWSRPLGVGGGLRSGALVPVPALPHLILSLWTMVTAAVVSGRISLLMIGRLSAHEKKHFSLRQNLETSFMS